MEQALQAVLAGNDMMLSTSAANENITPYKDNAHVMTAVREACHNILYTGVNSAAMNGVNSTTHTENVMTWWRVLYITLIVVFAVATVVCLIGFVFSKRKKKAQAR